MPLFAQFQPQPNDKPPEELLFAIIGGIVCVGCGLWLLIRFFYCRTLSTALQRCRPRNRTMEPGMAYLNLIPLFHLIWQFIAVARVSESLKEEFYDRGWDDRDDFGRSIGMAFAGLTVGGMVPYIGALFGLAALVCWIVHWVKVAGYSRELAEGGGRGRYDDDYDPHRRRGRRDDDDEYDDRR
jgi:hypothetical protein